MNWNRSRDEALLLAAGLPVVGLVALLAGFGGGVAGASVAMVVLALAGLAKSDASRMTVNAIWLLVLMAGGVAWRFAVLGETASEVLVASCLGAVAGLLVGAVPVAGAEVLKARWPFYPGDALLFAAVGCVLGPIGLAWALLGGSLCVLAHRIWVQHRRGRPVAQGYLPLGPGMAAGTFAVFVTATAGVAEFGIR